MKVLQINSTCGVGSTGKICVAISELLTENNIENYICYSTGKSNYKRSFKFCNNIYQKTQALKGSVFGNNGFNGNKSTQTLIKFLDEKKPKIIHLHNLHSNDINLEVLLKFIKDNHIKTFYTFHDCWAFTGYCTNFTTAKCEKWKNECYNCPDSKKYSWFFDRSKAIFKRKKEMFTGLDLTIITPSAWLADLVKQSFLKDYPVKVINNGIDLTVFKPTPSDFREKYNCANKFLLLGVAFGWGQRKGLDVFIELSQRLNADEYQIVLVGTDDKVDKQLPPNIISIHRTQNQAELAEIYTAADLFVNPTREEVLGMVNVEAIACGTPVLTFRTGGSPEVIDENCGSVVDCDDIDAMEKEIISICETKPFSEADCLSRAMAFDMNERFAEYIKLYG